MISAPAMYPIAHQVAARGALHRSDLTKILEFWRWNEIGGKELRRLSEVANERIIYFESLQSEWGTMVAKQWTSRKWALRDAAREAGDK